MSDLDTNSFYQIGKHIIKSNNSSIYVGMRRFKSFFGNSPNICVLAWQHIKYRLPADYKEIHLLWALFFLKCYNTEAINRSVFSCDEKTFRNRVWQIIDKLPFMKVIECEERRADSNPGQTCFVSLDGVDFLINEPHPVDPKYYSHKFKGAGLRYEIGLCIRSGQVVWKNGGYPCGDWHDINIARHLFTKFLERGEKAIPDKGYRDNDYFILPTEHNNAKHKAIMSRHETINKRIKQFNVLTTKFRNDKLLHKKCFSAVLNLTQLIIKKEAPLFAV